MSDKCPECGAKKRLFEDNWYTFDCGAQFNASSGRFLASNGCLEIRLERAEQQLSASISRKELQEWAEGNRRDELSISLLVFEKVQNQGWNAALDALLEWLAENEDARSKTP